MKKSLLALAVLGAFTSAASAQSSVTMYGRVDAAMGKGIGTSNKELGNGSGSRLGMRGVEDLGGGTQAIFNIEHRFEVDTATASAARFWHGRSIVGLQGGFGRVTLGREYSPAFTMSQLVADPWGWDNVVSGGYLGGVARGSGAIFGGGVVGRLAQVRYDNSVTYSFAMSGFSFGAQIAERDGGVDRPYSLAAGYAGGPFSIAASYERPNRGSKEQRWATINGTYAFGPAKLGAFYGQGNDVANRQVKSAAVTAVVGLGGGELRAMYGRLGGAGPNAVLAADGANSRMNFGAIGYHYPLSKRTTVYADVATDRRAANEKIGYDVGIKHNF